MGEREFLVFHNSALFYNALTLKPNVFLNYIEGSFHVIFSSESNYIFSLSTVFSWFDKNMPFYYLIKRLDWRKTDRFHEFFIELENKQFYSI